MNKGIKRLSQLTKQCVMFSEGMSCEIQLYMYCISSVLYVYHISFVFMYLNVYICATKYIQVLEWVRKLYIKYRQNKGHFLIMNLV